MNEVYGRLNGYIRDNTIVGMGSGTTIEKYIPALYEHVENNDLNIKFVPTSTKTEKLLKDYDLEVVYDTDVIDVTIDGADQFNTELMVIKGGGGSLLREKQIGYFSKNIIIVAHLKKLVEDFNNIAVPVEINPFLHEMTLKVIESETAARMAMREDGDSLFVTDNGNYIVDCHYDGLEDVSSLRHQLLNIPGVIETGIFDENIERIVAFDENEMKIF